MKSSSKLTCLLSLLILAGLDADVNLSREGDLSVYELASLNLQAYSPARILISYSYTNNFSVTDITSLGQSVYKISSGPTSIEFKAEDIDRYTFTVHLRYDVEVSQSIQMAIFSANFAPEGIQFNVKGTDIVLRFVLNVGQEPTYPSPEEVAEQVVRQVADQLMQFEARTNDVIALQNRNIETQWIVVGVSVTINIFLIVVFTLFARRGRVEVVGEG